MTIRVSSIDLDISIQCRAAIDTETVNAYAERMTEGDKFPPVVLFGTANQCYIGDGWHRIMAARQIALVEIDADLRPGGRIDALKYALHANDANGLRRTNEDKRRCVSVALKEFPTLSNRGIAEMCGVDHKTVGSVRAPFGEVPQSKRTGRDGKERPAHRPPMAESSEKKNGYKERATTRNGPPCVGMQFARLAIMRLEEIAEDDAERQQAFEHVKGWLKDHGS